MKPRIGAGLDDVQSNLLATERERRELRISGSQLAHRRGETAVQTVVEELRSGPAGTESTNG